VSKTAPGRDWLLRASLLGGAILVTVYLLETRVAERSWLTAFLTYAPQQPFLVPAVAMLGVAAARRRAKAFVVNVLALAFALFALLGFRVPRLGRDEASPSIHVMTWNIEHGIAGAASIAAVLQARRPEVICLQEASPPLSGPDPAPSIRRALPGYFIAQHGELLTASRFPILRATVHPMPIPGSRRAALETVVEAGGRPVTVWNLHFATGSSAARRPGDGALRRFARHWDDAGRVRVRQAEAMRDWTTRSSGAIVLCGDLNTPPRGRAFSLLTDRWTDAFNASGAGFGYTWSVRQPVLRIDHILTGGAADPVAVSVLPVRASDHRPLIARIALRGTARQGKLLPGRSSRPIRATP
jgi:vancomycin resistance protein VanJ